MSTETSVAKTAAPHLVVVHADSSGRHTAQVVGLPDVRVTADTPEEAVRQVRQTLTEWLAVASWVRVEVPAALHDHPLRRFAGHSRDDPDFDDYLEEIRRYREEVDRQACSSAR